MKTITLTSLALALLICGPVYGASFDCAKAKAADEKLICADRSLNDLDVRMITLLNLDLSTVAMGQAGEIHDAQSAWLKTRSACHADARCIAERYKTRNEALYDHLVRRMCGIGGPPC